MKVGNTSWRNFGWWAVRQAEVTAGLPGLIPYPLLATWVLHPTSTGFVELHSTAASAKYPPTVRLGITTEFGKRFSTLGFPTVLRLCWKLADPVLPRSPHCPRGWIITWTYFSRLWRSPWRESKLGDAGIMPAAYLGAGFQTGRVVPRAVPRTGQSWGSGHAVVTLTSSLVLLQHQQASVQTPWEAP